MALNMNTDINMIDMKSEYDSDCLSQYSDYESDYESEGELMDHQYQTICEMSQDEREDAYLRYRRNFQLFINKIKKEKENKNQTKKEEKNTHMFTLSSTIKPTVTKPIATIPIPSTKTWFKPQEVQNVDMVNILIEAKDDDKWISVQKKDKKKQSEYLTRDQIKKLNTKVEMCKSFRQGEVCKYGSKCLFAHSIDEIRYRVCEFMPCKRVRKVSHDCYANVDDKVCGCRHLNESDDNLYTRLSGIQKRVTEEEMDEFYLHLLESGEFDKPQEPIVKNKKPYVQKFKPMWPATFEEFKKLDIQALSKIGFVNNIHSKYFVQTYVSKQKTRNMMFVDLELLTLKQYPANKDAIKDFVHSIKKSESETKKILNNKVVSFKKDDIAKLQISEKNALNFQIRELKSLICRSEETVKRLKSQSTISVYDKKQIEKYLLQISEKSDKIKDTEKLLQDFQDINFFQNYLKSKEIKNVVVENTQCIPKIEKKTQPKVENQVISIIVNKKETVLTNENSEGWIEINKPSKKTVITPFIPAVSKPLSTKTRVCESVTSGKTCRHGDKCRFAHVKEELVVKKCDFASNCNNNNCQFKHDNESDNDFYSKVGFKCVVIKTFDASKIKPFVPKTNFANTPVAVPVVKLNSANTKTRMCESVLNSVKCRHGSKCRFAHSVDELKLTKCCFGDDCKLICIDSNGNYFNKNGWSRCTYQHPCETVENYKNRNSLN